MDRKGFASSDLLLSSFTSGRDAVEWVSVDLDGPPAVLLETWRPLTFHADGRVDLGAARRGPAASDCRFPPVTVRLTDDQLDALFLALFP